MAFTDSFFHSFIHPIVMVVWWRGALWEELNVFVSCYSRFWSYPGIISIFLICLKGKNTSLPYGVGAWSCLRVWVQRFRPVYASTIFSNILAQGPCPNIA